MIRRTWLSLALLTLLAPASGAADEGFVPLFNGKTLKGWTPVGGKPDNWHVKDGLLVTKGDGGGWLSSEKTYSNFVLKLEYRTGPAGNSGVFLRAPHRGDPAYTGMEVQLLDDDHPKYKTLQPYQYTGSVYGVAASERGHTRPPGEWNAIEIRAEGPKVTVTLNGKVITDADLKKADAETARTHPGILRPEGYIGLQSHSDEVFFRNISLRELR